jgi:hypothetical protein
MEHYGIQSDFIFFFFFFFFFRQEVLMEHYGIQSEVHTASHLLRAIAQRRGIFSSVFFFLFLFLFLILSIFFLLFPRHC